MAMKSQFEIDVRIALMNKGMNIKQLCSEVKCSRQALYDAFDKTCDDDSRVRTVVRNYLGL